MGFTSLFLITEVIKEGCENNNQICHYCFSVNEGKIPINHIMYGGWMLTTLKDVSCVYNSIVILQWLLKIVARQCQARYCYGDSPWDTCTLQYSLVTKSKPASSCGYHDNMFIASRYQQIWLKHTDCNSQSSTSIISITSFNLIQLFY